MSHSRILPSLGLILVLSAPAMAQTVTSSGLITESGRPIVGAPVIVDDGEPVFTDQDGRFTVDVEAGQRKFRVGLSGYRNIERTITAEMDKAAVVDFALEPVLEIVSLTVPAALTQGAPGQAQLSVRNTGASAYSLDQAGLIFLSEGRDRGADFTVQPDAANPTTIPAGQTVTLGFTFAPSANATPGRVTVRAGLFAFDSALGRNLLANSSFERTDDAGAPANWASATDGSTRATFAVVSDTAVTGSRSARVQATEAGDGRAYWSQPLALEPNKTYVLSGYIKTDQVESTTDSGAAVYVPVVVADTSFYQQPNSPWITGTRDWRKAIISFVTADTPDTPVAHNRGEIQQATGTAWFDNLSLTEGGVDGSLTLSGGDQTVEVAAAVVSAPSLRQPAANEVFRSNPPTFVWDPVNGATAYEVEVAANNQFTQPLEKSQVTGASFTPAKPLPMGSLFWRVRAVAGTEVSPWSERRYVQAFTPQLAMTAIGSTPVAPGGTGTVTLQVQNQDVFTYRVDAAGVRFMAGDQDVSGQYQVTADPANPAQIAPGETAALKLDVTAAADAPASGVRVIGNAFLYNTAVGSGANLIDNASLEAGEYDEAGFPELWGIAHDAPSDALAAWVQDVFLSGNRSFRMEKTAAQHQSYLQQLVPGDKLKPNTTYTVSAWFKTQDVPEGGGAGLLLWWNDGAYHPSSPIPQINGTRDWTQLTASFSTGDVQPAHALPRGNVFGIEGGTAWFDNFALSEGVVDGSVTLTGGSGQLGTP